MMAIAAELSGWSCVGWHVALLKWQGSSLHKAEALPTYRNAGTGCVGAAEQLFQKGVMTAGGFAISSKALKSVTGNYGNIKYFNPQI